MECLGATRAAQSLEGRRSLLERSCRKDKQTFLVLKTTHPTLPCPAPLPHPVPALPCPARPTPLPRAPSPSPAHYSHTSRPRIDKLHDTHTRLASLKRSRYGARASPTHIDPHIKYTHASLTVLEEEEGGGEGREGQ
ncbi:hypothetical protein E2C01_082007 [Portunus trituberculatus]|uniref:Uncharacterized protein n=1 Tax=Portunus trituberculatus TaxID=210409 RepID=A0A5B7IZN1_PORTR|nr:hypothetical protein [Portunus trituberculatus]